MPGRAIRSEASNRSSDADEGDRATSGKIDPRRTSPFDQIGAGDRTGQIGALGQIGRGGFIGRQAQLKRHRIFAQNVGQPLQFAVRRREERHAIALLHQRLRFGDGHLHAAVKRHRRPRADVRRAGVQIEFAQSDLRRGSRSALRNPPSERNSPRDRVPAAVRCWSRRFHKRSAARADLLRLIQHDHAHRRRVQQRMLARRCPAPPRIPSRETARPSRGCSISGSMRRLGDLHHGALRFDVEAADGFDLVAEKFDAQRARALGGKYVENAAADGILADHFDRIALFVADGLQMRFDGVERQFFADAQFQREAGGNPRRRACAAAPTPTGAMVIGALRRSPFATTPMARWPVISVCGESFWPGRTSSAGISCGPSAPECETRRSKNVSVSSASSFRALIAVGDHQQRTLGRLPQQNQVQRFRGGRQSGERKRSGFAPHQLAGQLLKRRDGGSESGTDREPRDESRLVSTSRASSSSTMLVVEYPGSSASAITLPPAASTSSRPAMKCAQSAPLIRMSGSTSAISSRGVSSSKNVTASTASRASAMRGALVLDDQRPGGTFEARDARVGIERQDQNVAQRTRLFEQADMARMQNIVTAVGEHHGLIFAAPLGARLDQFGASVEASHVGDASIFADRLSARRPAGSSGSLCRRSSSFPHTEAHHRICRPRRNRRCKPPAPWRRRRGT